MSANSSEKVAKVPVYWSTILLGLIVAAIFLVAIFSYQVQETERALVITMGQITGEQVRILMLPIAGKSFESMAKMKKIQPKMQRLQEIYKNDKMRLQQETLALYKKEKVNPASGCLPLLIQIPVFFSLYKVLSVSIEMRQAPFFGWIQT